MHSLALIAVEAAGVTAGVVIGVAVVVWLSRRAVTA